MLASLAFLCLWGAGPSAAEVKKFAYGEFDIVIEWSANSIVTDYIEVRQGTDILYRSEFVIVVSQVEYPVGSELSVFPLGLESDVTGDGYPDLVMKGWDGGAHCCFTTLVFQLEPTFMPIMRLETFDSDVEFGNLDKDSALELTLLDFTFRYWNTSFAFSPAPKVIIDWDQNVPIVSETLMRTPPPAQEYLDQSANEIRRRMKSSNELQPELWGTMLDLIYSGNGDLAFEFFESAWPTEWADKADFLKSFTGTLLCSPWAAEVVAMNQWKSIAAYDSDTCGTLIRENHRGTLPKRSNPENE